MRKLISSVLAVLLVTAMLFVGAVPAAAANLPTAEFEGKTYIDITSRKNFLAAAEMGFRNRSEKIDIFFRNAEKDWDENFSSDIRNFTGYNTKAVFTFDEYSPESIGITRRKRVDGVHYGDLEINYLDSAEELRKADALIDAKLKTLSSLSLPDKLLAVADYICSVTEAGFQKLPDGGFDTINGVYDVLSGVKTNVVCTSYAITFQRFMERAGIECFLLSNVRHAWNIVKVDGKWYGVDCTSDAGASIERRSFLMGKDTMKRYNRGGLDPLAVFGKNHTVSADDYNKAKPSVPPEKPSDSSREPSASRPQEIKPEASKPTASKPQETKPEASLPAVSEPEKTESADTSSEASSAEETGSAQSSSEPTEDKTAVSVKDDKTGVKIDANSGVLPEDVRLTVKEAESVPAEISGKYTAFDISLESGSGKIQPDGKVSVALPVPEGYDRERLAVYHIEDNGAKTELPCRVEGDSVIFETDHFSIYAVAEKAAEQNKGGSAAIWIVLCVLIAAAAGAGAAFVKLRGKKSAKNK